jgi:hypothetical protein
MDFTGVITKINLFFIIFLEISPYFELEKVPLFHKMWPLGHLSGGGGQEVS